MEAEVTQHVGAGRYERTAERTGERNGHRERRWDTRVGSIHLRVPRVRDGSYFPSLLEPRRRAERALVAVVQEAYVQGVSTRRVDDLGAGAGLARDQQEPGLADLRRPRYGGRALPQPPVGRGTPIRTSGWMRPSSRRGMNGRVVRRRRWSSRLGSMRRPGNARCWGSMSAPARTAPSGWPSCAAW